VRGKTKNGGKVEVLENKSPLIALVSEIYK